MMCKGHYPVGYISPPWQVVLEWPEAMKKSQAKPVPALSEQLNGRYHDLLLGTI